VGHMIGHFPPDIFKKMLDYGDQLLSDRQSSCKHDWAQSFGGIVLDSPIIDTPYGKVHRYNAASCVECYKNGYFDIVTQGYVESIGDDNEST